jgi:hypothetical protein
LLVHDRVAAAESQDRIRSWQSYSGKASFGGHIFQQRVRGENEMERARLEFVFRS